MDGPCLDLIVRQSVRRQRLHDTGNLFRRVLNNIRRTYKVPPARLYTAVLDLRAAAGAGSRRDTLKHCIAQVACHAPLLAELSYQHFAAFLAAGAGGLRACADRELVVVGVGGRAGHDAVGLVHALVEGRLAPRRVTVTLADRCPRWQLFFSVLVSEALAWGQSTCLSRFLNGTDFRYGFVRCDGGGGGAGLGEAARVAVGGAHLVLLGLDEEDGKAASNAMVEEVARQLKTGSLLCVHFADRSLLPDSAYLKCNFEVRYFDHRVATIDAGTSIMGIECCTTGCSSVLILQRK